MKSSKEGPEASVSEKVVLEDEGVARLRNCCCSTVLVACLLHILASMVGNDGEDSKEVNRKTRQRPLIPEQLQNWIILSATRG